jgi:cell shape-determining protein MreD
MNWLPTIFIVAVTFLAVYLEASWDLPRHWLGTQVDLLPALMVYTSLTHGLGTIILLACCGGLWFDSLSLNPLGVSVLPLLLIGLCIYRSRDLLLRRNTFAQVVLGVMAGAAQPAGALFLLLNLGGAPALGWFSVWQWIVLAVGGGVLAPVCFEIFDRLHLALDYQPSVSVAFRSDRQIKRGRQ